MTDRDLFESYVKGLEESRRLRESVEGRVREARAIGERLQVRIEQCRTITPHDPVVTLGVTEHGKAVRTATSELSDQSMAIMSETAKFESDLLARAQEMLRLGNFDLKGLLEDRLNHTRRQLEEKLPKLLEAQDEVDESRKRFEAFLDESFPNTA